jgi:hypothetical protein
MKPEPDTNPNVIVIPTNNPGRTEAEYVARGWKCCDLYSKPFYPDLCAGHQWSIQFWRSKPSQQPELL